MQNQPVLNAETARRVAAEAVVRARSALEQYMSKPSDFQEWRKADGDLVTTADSGGAGIGAWVGEEAAPPHPWPSELHTSIVGFECSPGATFPHLASVYGEALRRAEYVHTYGSAVFMGAQSS